MRTLIVIDVEIDDGVRPGTGFARLEWVARSVARFIGNQRRVQEIHRVTVHPTTAATLLPAAPFLTINPGALSDEETR